MFLFRYACVYVLNSALRRGCSSSAPPLERVARAAVSADSEHCTHTDASKLTSLVPLFVERQLCPEFFEQLS